MKIDEVYKKGEELFKVVAVTEGRVSVKNKTGDLLIYPKELFLKYFVEVKK